MTALFRDDVIIGKILCETCQEFSYFVPLERLRFNKKQRAESTLPQTDIGLSLEILSG